MDNQTVMQESSDSGDKPTVSRNPKASNERETNVETISTLIRNLKLGKATDNCASLNDRYANNCFLVLSGNLTELNDVDALLLYGTCFQTGKDQ